MRLTFLLSVLAVCLAGCGTQNESETAAPARKAKPTNPQMLVGIWKAEEPSADDPTVRLMARYLHDLRRKCPKESEGTIAARIDKARSMLKEKEIEVSPIQLARDVDKAAPGPKIHPWCIDVLSTLAGMMEYEHGVPLHE
jgi:hypothetical protein